MVEAVSVCSSLPHSSQEEGVREEEQFSAGLVEFVALIEPKAVTLGHPTVAPAVEFEQEVSEFVIHVNRDDRQHSSSKGDQTIIHRQSPWLWCV